MKLKQCVFAVLACLTVSVLADDKPYTVVDGYKVDAKTMEGFRTWRAAACDRCHGAVSYTHLTLPTILRV